MHRNDLINPQTEEQEAEIAAYIASECARIQATWTERDEADRRAYDPIPEVTVTKVRLSQMPRQRGAT